MRASSFVTLLAGIFVAGCGGVVRVGLANAPALGGTPETRVHDVVANGDDACERGMFPQGEVLRGQVPSCLTPVRAPMPAPAPVVSDPAVPSAPAMEWFHACEADLSPSTPPREVGFAALYLSAPPPWTTCDARRAARPSAEGFERPIAHRTWGELAIARP